MTCSSSVELIGNSSFVIIVSRPKIDSICLFPFGVLATNFALISDPGGNCISDCGGRSTVIVDCVATAWFDVKLWLGGIMVVIYYPRSLSTIDLTSLAASVFGKRISIDV
jgi:hypothetical protein